ncbi:unnamed protein product [Prunus armeniaca]|uniref:Uncharacterized protein n=1 Tax=Prunus armeniaca TaxID=36596 RepID=A0A6J5WY48_PRUAR|nr:unnamed protein product [Prunus armeniaca]CAB4306419.1 unnamed protein product [Prunus armeniaca]
MEREKIVGLGSKKPEQNTKSTVLKLKSDSQTQSSSKTGPWRKMLSSKDINFVGYAYKNFEIINDYQLLINDSQVTKITGKQRKHSIVSTKASLKKKSTKPKRLSADEESETSDSGSSHPVQGSFLNLLPPQLEVPQHRDNSL